MKKRLFSYLSAVAVFLILFSACDQPVDPELHAVGVVLIDSSAQEVARFTTPGSRNGGITVAAGATETFQVRLVDASGGVRPIDGVEYSIRDPRIIIAHLASVALVGSDLLAITGIQPVELTSLQFEIWHGAHQEFLADGIPLRVE